MSGPVGESVCEPVSESDPGFVSESVFELVSELVFESMSELVSGTAGWGTEGVPLVSSDGGSCSPESSEPHAVRPSTPMTSTTPNGREARRMKLMVV